MNESIYAPWRTEFILGRREKGCVFCTRYKRKTDREDFILYRGRHNFILLNLYPYNSGHVLIIPNRHISTLTRMRPAERTELMELAAACEIIMKDRLKPQGLNMGFNFGGAGGAGIRDHLHLHVVPRWTGDTNFMPVICDTRVNSVDLRVTYDILLPAFEKLAKRKKIGGQKISI